MCRNTFCFLFALVTLIGSSRPVLGQPLLRTGATLSQVTATTQTQPTSTNPVRRLSVDEAVALALEQNLSIQVERMNPAIQDLSVATAQSVWQPSLTTTFRTQSQNSPPNSFLSGGQLKVSDDEYATVLGVSQQLRSGGNYSLQWDSSRSTTTNIFTNFNPVLSSRLTAAFTQPLVRNYRIDPSRQQLLISRKNREVSDVQLRQLVVSTMRNVKNAYWDLVYARASLTVQQQSLDLARESLRNNTTRVNVGTMAPIDIVEAEAEVARNEETVIVAEAAIDQSEDRLRALILDPATADFWTVRLEPTDRALLDIQTVDIDAAVRNALDKRTDLQQAKKNLEASDINIQYYRNQTLPEVNLEATYGLSGLGGTELVRGAGFPGPVIGQDQRSYGSVLGDLFRNDFPTWTVGLTIGYPLGTSQAEANLARARLQYTQTQTEIRNLQLQVVTQVRDLGRQVNTNLKRIDATRASRELNERRLDAEQRKFAVGTSTSFIVFQAQRDLAQARNNELRAILDYKQSLVDFEGIQESSLSGSGGTISVTTSSQSSVPVETTRATTSTTASGASQQFR